MHNEKRCERMKKEKKKKCKFNMIRLLNSTWWEIWKLRLDLRKSELNLHSKRISRSFLNDIFYWRFERNEYDFNINLNLTHEFFEIVDSFVISRVAVITEIVYSTMFSLFRSDTIDNIIHWYRIISDNNRKRDAKIRSKRSRRFWQEDLKSNWIEEFLERCRF